VPILLSPYRRIPLSPGFTSRPSLPFFDPFVFPFFEHLPRNWTSPSLCTSHSRQSPGVHHARHIRTVIRPGAFPCPCDILASPVLYFPPAPDTSIHVPFPRALSVPTGGSYFVARASLSLTIRPSAPLRFYLFPSSPSTRLFFWFSGRPTPLIRPGTTCSHLPVFFFLASP